jgi:hypothetical protein
MAAEVTLDLEGWYEFKAQHLGSGQRFSSRTRSFNGWPSSCAYLRSPAEYCSQALQLPTSSAWLWRATLAAFVGFTAKF